VDKKQLIATLASKGILENKYLYDIGLLLQWNILVKIAWLC